LNKKTKNLLETLAYILIGYLIAVGANKGLALAMNTNYPVVAVVSTSMEHQEELTYKTWFHDRGYNETEMGEWPFQFGMKKGDIVFVKGTPHEEIKQGDIIVYKVENGEPIIHRVIDRKNGMLYTKGDNNMEIDQEDMSPPIDSEILQGRAIFRIPFLGYVKLTWMAITGSG